MSENTVAFSMSYIVVPDGDDVVSRVDMNRDGRPCDGLYDLLERFGEDAVSDFENAVALIVSNTVKRGLKAPPYASFHITNTAVILYWFGE